MKKWLCILLALALSCSCLAACGKIAEADTPSPSPETETPEPSPDTPAAEQPAVDLAAARSAYDAGVMVMTVDGAALDWNKYSSALFDYLYTFYANYGITDFNLELEEGRSIAEMAKKYAFDALAYSAMLHNKAAEEGVSLTEEQRASLDAEIERYASVFAEAGITEEYYRYQVESTLLYNALLERYFGENCADFPTEDALAWAEDNGYLHAKHILLKTVDNDYNPLDEETIAKKRATAEDILARLQAADESVRADLFDALMSEFSEDGGSAVYPDGYYFQEGDMIPEFYEGTLALAPGEISGIVEGFYGYHIIERLPLDADQTADFDASAGTPKTLRMMTATELFENMLEEWYDAQDVRYAGDFESLDVAALFPAPEGAEETVETG